MRFLLFLAIPVLSTEIGDLREIIAKMSFLGIDTENVGQHAAALVNFESDLESIKEEMDQITKPKSPRKVYSLLSL